MLWLSFLLLNKKLAIFLAFLDETVEEKTPNSLRKILKNKNRHFLYRAANGLSCISMKKHKTLPCTRCLHHG